MNADKLRSGVLHLVPLSFVGSPLLWDDAPEQQFWLNSVRSTKMLWRPDLALETVSAGEASILPIRCHSHNDYDRARPFFQAIGVTK
jgi:hypothetical protein